MYIIKATQDYNTYYYNYQIWRKYIALGYIYRRRLNNRKSERRRRFKVRPIFQNRQEHGAYNTLIAEMRLNNPEKYLNYFRMSVTKFEELLGIIGPKLLKNDTFCDIISPAERLSLTLRYLASGDLMTAISYQFRIGRSTVSSIIYETCMEIWNNLNEEYLKQPDLNKWLEIANEFETKWNFPHCIGAVGGKHIVMKAKGQRSLILFAVCNANYCFTMVDVGAQERHSDGGIFRSSNIGKCFYQGKMNLPPSQSIISNGPLLPFVLVADETFQLTNFLMSPYPGQTSLSQDCKIYNYRLSRARSIIENSFGILAAKWQILLKPIIAQVKTGEAITLACICLHNFLMQTELQYCPAYYVDRDDVDGKVIRGAWRTEDGANLPNIRSAGCNTYSRDAESIRSQFKEYFNTASVVVH